MRPALGLDYPALVLACLLVCLGGCRRARSTGPVAATNTFLQCAAEEMLGKDSAVLRLCEPGMCPSHVELRPSQVESLRHCRLLLRFDFQGSMDRRMGGLCKKGLDIAEISITGGMCEPGSYISACSQVADALVAAGLLDVATAEQRLDAVRRRVAADAEALQARVASLAGTPVMASEHQAAFCRWLGLDVVATFTAADTARPGRLDEAIAQAQTGAAKLIIGNQPEGRMLVDRLADRLGLDVVMFGNFPDLAPDGSDAISFDGLLGGNVAALLEAAGR